MVAFGGIGQQSLAVHDNRDMGRARSLPLEKLAIAFGWLIHAFDTASFAAETMRCRKDVVSTKASFSETSNCPSDTLVVGALLEPETTVE